MHKIIYDDKTKVGILEGKICPFRNPLILPGQIAGRVVIENIPCSTSCALFKLEQTAGEQVNYKLCCGNDLTYQTAILEIVNNKPNLKIT